MMNYNLASIIDQQFHYRMQYDLPQEGHTRQLVTLKSIIPEVSEPDEISNSDKDNQIDQQREFYYYAYSKVTVVPGGEGHGRQLIMSKRGRPDRSDRPERYHNIIL